MEFKEFKRLFQHHFKQMVREQNVLFVTNTDKEILWEKYLENFPPGTNKIFRKKREFDCSCCRHFIKSFGNVVIIKDSKLISIWDFETNDTIYQPVINALSIYVKEQKIKDVFITKESVFGVDYNHERLNEKTVHTWGHFIIKLSKKFVDDSNKTEDTIKSQFRDIKNVFVRSLEEISKDAIETILDLITQKSLYKGEEWQKILIQFLALHVEYHNLPEKEKDIYCWNESIKVGGVIGKIKNHSIGMLLTDITKGIDLNAAVKKYEVIVAPTNYKRPKAIFTKKMIEQAQKTITELGILDSLGRRFATIEDITVNNILFANKDTLKQMTGDIFTELKQEVIVNLKKFDKTEEIPIDIFIRDILPRTTNIEIYLENKHAPNFVSVIAPAIKNSKNMFKWNNNSTWVYDKNITDSMKEIVKAAGGKIDGILRKTIQWNKDKYNPNDFDAHCIEPNGNHIWFQKKIPYIHPSTGRLDVDIIDPVKGVPSVENITWTDINKMQEGRYKFYVHNYTYRGGRSGFEAEIEYDGQIYSYEYNKELRQDEEITIAEFEFSRQNGIKFIKSLPSSASSKIIWNLSTNQFHPVSICMFSPNYWDEQKGIGHKHYFFIINGCKNQDRPNGFFNEFLREDLLEHKRVFEALGSKMHVEPSNNQLSGLGFSSTKRNSLMCKLKGHITRTLKIVF